MKPAPICNKCTLIASAPSKAVCREIGPALWKNGSTDFVRMSKRYAFSWQFSQFSAKANGFGARTSQILSNLVKLALAQKPLIGNTANRTGLRQVSQAYCMTGVYIVNNFADFPDEMPVKKSRFHSAVGGIWNEQHLQFTSEVLHHNPAWPGNTRSTGSRFTVLTQWSNWLPTTQNQWVQEPVGRFLVLMWQKLVIPAGDHMQT